MKSLMKWVIVGLLLLLVFKLVSTGQHNARNQKSFGGLNSLGEPMQGYAGGVESNTSYPVNGPYGAW